MTVRIDPRTPPAVPTLPAAPAPVQTPPTRTCGTVPSSFQPGGAPSNVLTGTSASGGAQPTISPTAAVSLDLTTPEAQTVIQRTISQLNARRGAGTNEFSARDVTVDAYGMTHLRLDRTHEGTKVFGEQVVATLTKEGKLSSVFGDEGTINVRPDRTALISADQALAAAQADFGSAPEGEITNQAVLVKNADGEYVHAFHVELTNLTEGEPRRQNYLVDAKSGQVLESWNQIDTFIKEEDIAAAKASGAISDEPVPTEPTEPSSKDDTTLYSGQVEIGATPKEDGTFSLTDQNRGKGVITKDAQNKSTGSGATEVTDNNNVWGEVTDSPRNAAAVDAQYGGQMTYDFYKQVLGRDSIDGKGEALQSNVHIRQNYVNAFWDGKTMNYGDGDGKTASVLTSLDIAGHEITHGLTQRTAGLIYRGESGGLNEAMSDIFGKGVEWMASQQNPAVKFTWGVGEAVWTPGKDGDALRYMDDPSKDGRSFDHYSKYKNQDVHYSSGIANNAFVLLTQGGTNKTSGQEVKDGIGMEASLKIFGRALTTYMTPSTTFSQARAATIQAATDMFGAESAEVAKVKEVWTAVGVE